VDFAGEMHHQNRKQAALLQPIPKPARCTNAKAIQKPAFIFAKEIVEQRHAVCIHVLNSYPFLIKAFENA